MGRRAVIANFVIGLTGLLFSGAFIGFFVIVPASRGASAWVIVLLIVIFAPPSLYMLFRTLLTLEKASSDLIRPLVARDRALDLWIQRTIRESFFGFRIGRVKHQILRSTSETPGISHNKLTASLGGSRPNTESAIKQLLDDEKLRCEQRGRVRRYFATK